MLIAALAIPASASAGTASITGSTLTYDAASGEQNDVAIETDGSVFRVVDNISPVTAGTGCNQRATHRVNCPKAGLTLVEVLARDQDDTVVTTIGTTNATLNGGSGSDTLTSAGGNDTLIAGKSDANGSESLSAGSGNDTLNGATNSVSSTFMGAGPGDDNLIGGPGFDSLFGDLGADDLQGGGAFDFVSWGGSAPINVTVGSGANDGEPGEGDNVHADVEQVFGTSFGDTMIGTEGSQTFSGFDGNDTLQGGAGDDSLQGHSGVDSLSGGDGADSLQGGADPDNFVGGPGVDTVDYNDHSTPVTVTINNNANDGTGAEGDNVHTDVENLRGTFESDSLTGSTGDNLIDGFGGNDTIAGLGGDDTLFGDFQFSSGTIGNDTLNGGNGDDNLFGGGGADDYTGGNDFDFVDYSQHAGAANLTVTIDNVANDGEAGEGDNVRTGVEGVVGSSGNDNFTGSSGVNTLRGGQGSDTLKGAGGNDVLQDDRCCSFFADVLDGGSGIDTADYRSHPSFNPVVIDLDDVADDGGLGTGEGDNVKSNVENLIGSEGPDQLTGDNAANSISGRSGNDTLIGGGAGDTLTGNGGVDTHEGQAGQDQINSRGDGFPDTVNCGTESDVAIVDSPADTVNPDCETVFP